MLLIAMDSPQGREGESGSARETERGEGLSVEDLVHATVATIRDSSGQTGVVVQVMSGASSGNCLKSADHH